MFHCEQRYNVVVAFQQSKIKQEIIIKISEIKNCCSIKRVAKVLEPIVLIHVCQFLTIVENNLFDHSSKTIGHNLTVASAISSVVTSFRNEIQMYAKKIIQQR